MTPARYREAWLGAAGTHRVSTAFFFLCVQMRAVGEGKGPRDAEVSWAMFFDHFIVAESTLTPFFFNN